MVRCKCGRALLWTTAGKVTCPAGHTVQFEVADGPRGEPGTPYCGTSAPLRIAPIPEAVNLTADNPDPSGSFDPASPLGFKPLPERCGKPALECPSCDIRYSSVCRDRYMSERFKKEVRP